ncbi:unnamed protein product [Vitrella brassicaformis CCMP3155]|uniref:Protein kinase domain-containing protein n=1 Tax=Vitrella brassicaformis (strain CCMP3155) TaxID=1169540 RepID=A0A0G4F5I3_VITBC|nr:unnamed protein product [Vitrella brassicaformis CCMP3155]|eukprot:CEM07005.1 unnamed protein product [Vitrella brassicaformis CCMP3155]
MADLLIDPKDLTVSDKELGSGGFGIVRRGELRGRPVAVKIYKGHEELDRESQFMEVLRKALPMTKLDHPNIVRLLGVCRDDKHGLMTVIELCEGGSLASYLASHGPLPLDVRDKFTKQICEAVKYMHDNHIVHRDLKPENILVGHDRDPPMRGSDFLLSHSSKLDEGHNIKLSDFGMIRSAQRKTTLTAVGGTPNYMPPEGFDTDLDKLTAKADIWALGGILGEIHGGRPPFEGKVMAQISRKVVNKKEIPDIPASLPPHIKTAIKMCFAYKTANRPTAKQVLDKLRISSSHCVISWRPFVGCAHEHGQHHNGAASSVAKTSQPPSQHIVPPAQQPSVKTPPRAPQPQIKHWTPFIVAAAEGHVGVMSVMYESKPDVLQQTDNQLGNTALHRAAWSGRVAAVNKLMEWDPKLIDARNKYGWTPFMSAAYNGHVDVLEALLEWGGGALLDIKDNEGYTPWDEAAEFVISEKEKKKAEIREIMQKYKR